ncbi:MAG: CAP domain-containing protein [Chloroflexota bacterium]
MAIALAAVVLAATVLINASPSSADASLSADEQQFLTLINNYRAQSGLKALVAQDDLNEASDWYATDMATKNYYGDYTYCYSNFGIQSAHCDSLGRMPPQRAEDWGYPQGVGENSAAGFCTAQAVFDAWKGSAGHNANMLGNYSAIGIGEAINTSARYRCYWVTDFGFYAGPGSPPGPSDTQTPSPQPTQQPTPPPTFAPTPTPTFGPTQSPVPTEPATDTPVPTEVVTTTPVPTEPPANLTWDDVDCSGAINAEDAVAVLRGGIGFSAEASGCPSVWDLIQIDGAYRVWGDTDCSLGVQVQDAVKLLAYLSGVAFDVKGNCPDPGAHF